MSMFDSLVVKCSCGAPVQFQSKASSCTLEEYTLDDVPDLIAASCIGESRRCSQCNATVTLRGRVILMKEVAQPR